MLATGEWQQRAAELGVHLHARLNELVGHGVLDVHGRGLWAGVDIDPSLMTGREASEAMLAEGILVKDTHGSTIRFAPPIVVTDRGARPRRRRARPRPRRRHPLTQRRPGSAPACVPYRQVVFRTDRLCAAYRTQPDRRNTTGTEGTQAWSARCGLGAAGELVLAVAAAVVAAASARGPVLGLPSRASTTSAPAPPSRRSLAGAAAQAVVSGVAVDLVLAALAVENVEAVSAAESCRCPAPPRRMSPPPRPLITSFPPSPQITSGAGCALEDVVARRPGDRARSWAVRQDEEPGRRAGRGACRCPPCPCRRGHRRPEWPG